MIFSLNTISSVFLLLSTTTLVNDPPLSLCCSDLSTGSAFGFSSSITLPEASVLPSSIALARRAASEILTESPLVRRVKKNLPYFEFLSATMVKMLPPFLRISIDESIGSSSLYIASISSVSADLGPEGTLEILLGVAFTKASFTPFCSLSFSFDAISGFATSEGFFSPGLALAGVTVDDYDDAEDLLSGS